MTERKKVLFVAPESLPVPPVRGGAVEAVIDEAARKLAACLSVAVVSTSDATLPLAHESDGVRYLHVKRQCSLARDKLQLRLVKLPFLPLPLACYRNPYVSGVLQYIAAEQPDIVHIHNSPIYVLFVRKQFPRMKIVLHMHNRHLVRMNRRLGEKIVAQADAIVGVSQYIVNEITAAFPESQSRCTCLYNGVDLNLFRPKASFAIDAVKKKYKVHPEKRILLFAGRLIPQKGIHLLLQTLGKMEMPNWQLVIVGASWFQSKKESSYIKKLKALAAQLDNEVVFTGYVPHKQMPEVLAMADFLVFPSIGPEAFPLTVLESQAVGVPVICNAAGGAAESILEGKTGFINSILNFDGLKRVLDLMKRLSSKEYYEMVEQSRVHVEEKFNMDGYKKTYKYLYKRFLDSGAEKRCQK